MNKKILFAIVFVITFLILPNFYSVFNEIMWFRVFISFSIGFCAVLLLDILEAIPTKGKLTRLRIALSRRKYTKSLSFHF